MMDILPPRCRMVWALLAAILVCSLVSCSANTRRVVVTSNGKAISTAARKSVPAPPGISPDHILPLTDDKLTRAMLTLDDVIASMDKPKYAKLTPGPPGSPEKVIPEPPLAAQQAYVQGRFAMDQGRRFEATKQFEDARRLAPNAVEPVRMLAKSNPANATFYLQRALMLDPGDLQSAFELGRSMVELRRWEDATMAFAHARTLRHTPEDNESARWPLIDFYLGTALQSLGYDAAAIECWTRFVTNKAQRGLTMSLAYHLALAQRQKGLIWQSIGDAHHRLGHVQAAMFAYNRAADIGIDDAYRLIARVAYTLLRMGQAEAAHQAVMKYFDRLDKNPDQIELVMYLTRHGIDGATIAHQLKPMYRDQNRPARLALLLAELLGPKQGAILLQEHLQQMPTDHAVLAALIDLQLGHPESLGDLAVRCADAVDAKASNPKAAHLFARILVDRIEDQATLQKAIDALPQEQRARLAILYIRAISLLQDHKADQAVKVLKTIIENKSAPAAARIALARLLIESKDYPQVRVILEPLEALQLASVVSLQATALAHTDDVAKAIALLDQAIALQDEDVELIVTKAKLQLDFLDIVTAERTLLDALVTRPAAEPIYLELFDLYDNSTQHLPDREKQWVRLMWQMLRAIPDSRVARLKSAEWELVNKKYGPAESALRRLLIEDPKDYQALDAMLELLSATNRNPESEKLLDEALRSDPEDPHLRDAALVHLIKRLKKPEKAEILLRQAVKEQPGNVEVLDELLQVLVLTDRLEESTQLLEKRLQASPDDEKLLAVAIKHYIKRSKSPDKADVLWERLLLKKPATAARDFELSGIYIRQGRISEAIEIILVAIERGDNIQKAFYYRFSSALEKIKEDDKRDQLASDAIKRLPQHEAELWFFWAMSYESQGQHEQAERMMIQILQKFPKHPDTNNSLGYMWSYMGKNLEQARAMIEVAVNTDPKSAAYLDSLGWVHYKLGNFDKAVLWLKRAQKANTQSDSIILDHVGDALYQTDKHSEALKHWKLSKQHLDPTSPSTDPERQSLADRLELKIKAATNKAKVPVAKVPEPLGEKQPMPLP